VWQPQGLETAGEALRQPLGHQQRGRAEQYDLEGSLLARVLVPEPLDHLRPGRDLLDLIEHQHGAAVARCFQPRRLPLLADPVSAAERRLVGTGVADRQAQLIGDLPDQRRLADLAWTGHDVQKSARLGQPLGQHGGLGASELALLFAHFIELRKLLRSGRRHIASQSNTLLVCRGHAKTP